MFWEHTHIYLKPSKKQITCSKPVRNWLQWDWGWGGWVTLANMLLITERVGFLHELVALQCCEIFTWLGLKNDKELKKKKKTPHFSFLGRTLLLEEELRLVALCQGFLGKLLPNYRALKSTPWAGKSTAVGRKQVWRTWATQDGHWHQLQSRGEGSMGPTSFFFFSLFPWFYLSDNTGTTTETY